MKRKILFVLIALALSMFAFGLIACGEEEHVHSYDIVTITKATCTAQGFTTHTCSCGDSYDDTYENKLPHTYTTVVTSPTCTEQGYTTHTCDCGETYTDAYVRPLGHISGPWETTLEPTCTEKGSKHILCTICSEEVDVQEIVELGHKFDNYISDNNATYEADGTKTSSCSNDNCEETNTIEDYGSKLVETTVVLNKTELELAVGEVESLITTIIPSTMSNQEIMWASSDSTIATITQDGIIEAVKPGKVTISASSVYAKQPATCELTVIKGQIEYTISENQSFYIVTGTRGRVVNAVVQEIYNNLRVMAIGDMAFYGNNDLETVVLPDSVETIGFSAFENCHNLKSISFTESVKTVDFSAFKNCVSLNAVTLSNSVKSLGASAFSGCLTLSTIEFGESLQEIGANAFENCLVLTDLTFPENLYSIGSFAFDNCPAIEEIVLPNSLVSLGTGAFRKATALQSLTLSTGLSAIQNITFQGCTKLAKVEILSNINSIGLSAFSDCIKLKEINVLGNLSSLGNSAFYNCESLTNVYYNSSAITSLSADNYVFYNAGIKGGITFTASANAYIPYRLFTPTVEESTHPRINVLCIEDETQYVNYDISENPLPYLAEIEIASSVKQLNYGFINACKKAIETVSSVEYLDKWVVGYTGTRGDAIIREGSLAITDQAFSGHTSLTSLVIPEGVATISAYTFSGCTSLSSITIPNSVTSIGYAAFGGCTSMSSMTLPFVGDRIKDYSDYNQYPLGYIFGDEENERCYETSQKHIGSYGSSIYSTYYIPHSLKSVIITGGEILSGAFYNCKGLESIIVPNSATMIGENAFYNCSSLKEIEVPENVTSIGNNVFSGCGSLESMILPFVGNYAKTSSEEYQYPFGYVFGTSLFENSIQINQQYYRTSGYTTSTTYYIPSTLKNVIITGGEILYGAFYNCSGLESIVLPSSATMVGEYAFYNCSSLKDIDVPESVLSMGANSFSGCSALESMTLPFVGDSIKTSYDYYQYPFGYIFGGTTYTGSEQITQSYYASSLSSTTSVAYYIPNSLKSVIINGGNILYGAFRNCRNIKSIEFAEGITSIGADVFYNCRALEDITLPSTLTDIGKGAFYNCSALANIEIPASVYNVGTDAFYGCNGLSGVDYLGTIDQWAEINFASAVANPMYFAKKLNINGQEVTEVVLTDTTKIGGYAFYNGINIESVTIGESVTNIGANAFYGCSGLSKVDYLGTIDQWVTINFVNEFSNPTYYVGKLCINGGEVSAVSLTDATKINGYSFYNCTNLTSVSIPESVIECGVDAFYGCTGLIRVNYGGTIDQWAEIDFADTEANPLTYAKKLYQSGLEVTQVHLTDVINIGEYVFNNGVGITSVTIPSSVENIGTNAFNGCSGLTRVNYGGTIDQWAMIGFANASANPLNYAKKLYINDVAVTEIKLTNATEIGSFAFRNCSAITSIEIPTSVINIGSGAFYGCSALNKVYYLGTSSQWANINIVENNTILTNAKRYYYSSINPYTDGSGLSYANNYYYYNGGVPTIWMGEVIVNASQMGVAYTTSGSWTSQLDGSIKSSSIGHNSSTSYTVNITRSGTFIYSYKTSTESNYDKLTVYKNGSTILSGISGIQTSFTSKSVSVVAGDQIKFTYSKDSSQTSGDDAVYIKLASGPAGLGSLYGTQNSQLSENIKTVSIVGSGAIVESFFEGCPYITTVIIGSGITSIGNNAFNGCTALTKVYYNGDATAWSGVIVGSNNTPLTSATVYFYTETAPEVAGNFWHYVDGVPTAW